jgi:hypothetical protein
LDEGGSLAMAHGSAGRAWRQAMGDMALVGLKS